MIASQLLTIAGRHWHYPTGEQRAKILKDLRAAAGERNDLLIQVAGVMLGLRPDDKNSRHYARYNSGAAMLLEVAETSETDPRVQRWIPEGRRRRDGWRQPEPSRDW
jgi:hypothetical protein